MNARRSVAVRASLQRQTLLQCGCWRHPHLCPLLFSPGLTDDEIDLAFQQSGTATEEPPSLGLATPVAPVQTPHLIAQPCSKSPDPRLAELGLGLRTLAKSKAPQLPPKQNGRTWLL